MAGAQRNERLLHGGRQQLRLLITVRHDRVETEHDIGLVELLRRLEPLAIDLDRLHHHLRREVRCEGVAEAKHSRELRAEQARAQDPDRDVHPFAGDGADAAVRPPEIADELDDIARELVGVGAQLRRIA